MQKIDFATLPVSVSSWIVLRDCFQECGDPEMLYKIIDDYYSELPLYEIYRLFISWWKLQTMWCSNMR